MTNISRYIIGKDDCRFNTVARIFLQCSTATTVINKRIDIAIGLDLDEEAKNRLENGEKTPSVIISALLTSFSSIHGTNAKLETFISVLRNNGLNDAAEQLTNHFNGDQVANLTMETVRYSVNPRSGSVSLDGVSHPLSHSNEFSSFSRLLSTPNRDTSLLEDRYNERNNSRRCLVGTQFCTKYVRFLFIFLIILALSVALILVFIYYVGSSKSHKASSPNLDIDHETILEQDTQNTSSVVIPLSVTTSREDVNFLSSDRIDQNVSASSLIELNSKLDKIILFPINLYLTVYTNEDWQPISEIKNSLSIKSLSIYLVGNPNILASILFYLYKIEVLVVQLGAHFQNPLSLIELDFTMHHIRTVVILKENHNFLYSISTNFVDIKFQFCEAFPDLEIIKSEVPIPYTSFVRLGTCRKLKHVEASVYFSDSESFWDMSSLLDQNTLTTMKLELIFVNCPSKEKLSWLGLSRIREKILEQNLASKCNLYTNYTRETEVLYSSYYENKTVN